MGGRGFTRDEVVLAGMAAGGLGTLFEPGRLRVLLLVIDREIPEMVGGPHFDFGPDRFGPRDPQVDEALDALREAGRVRLRERPGYATWALTAAGFDAGGAALRRLPMEMRRYVVELARWALALRFSRLLGAIGHRYPELNADDAAPGIEPGSPTLRPGGRLRSFLERMTGAFGGDESDDDEVLARIRGRSDAEALAEDWRLVGDDLRAALAAYGTSTAPITPPIGRPPEEPPDPGR